MTAKEKLTLKEVKKIVLDSMKQEDLRNYVLYIDERIYPKGSEISIKKNRYQFTSDTIIVFIDEEPGKNWGHKCRYLFFNIDSHQINEIHERFPPFLTDIPETFRLFWKPRDMPSWFLLINNNEVE